MITPEQQKIVDDAKAKAINAIESEFSIIHEYFQTDLSLARFALNKNMTIWQFKWLLNKNKIPPKAKKYIERRKTIELAESYEDREDHERPLLAAGDKDDFSGEY